VIDPAVGLTEVAGVGDVVDHERPLAIVHARDEAGAEAAERALRAAIAVAEEAAEPGPAVAGRIG
jgi:thymidine phosphorylase